MVLHTNYSKICSEDNSGLVIKSVIYLLIHLLYFRFVTINIMDLVHSSLGCYSWTREKILYNKTYSMSPQVIQSVSFPGYS